MNQPTQPDHRVTEDSPGPENSHRSTSTYLRALQVVGITSGFIFGPMIVFGGIGWVIGNMIDRSYPMFISLVIALAVTNLLIFTRTQKVLDKIQ